jgi:hypothetical protein
VKTLLPETAASHAGSALRDDPGRRRLTIVSGGQSGVDRAALDTALLLGLPCRGWCPKGRWAEDGPIPLHYPLQETDTATVGVRTELNVLDSDGTLILALEKLAGGTGLTAKRARHHDKPLRIQMLTDAVDREAFWLWIEQNHIRTLNIAGPRESRRPGFIYLKSKNILMDLLNHDPL